MNRLHAKLALISLPMVSGSALAHIDSSVHLHPEYTATLVLAAVAVFIAVLKRKKLSVRKSNNRK